jgi:hypothetical protein
MMDFKSTRAAFVIKINANFVCINIQMLWLRFLLSLPLKVSVTHGKVSCSLIIRLLDSIRTFLDSDATMAEVARLPFLPLVLLVGRFCGMLESFRYSGYFIHAFEIEFATALKQLC